MTNPYAFRYLFFLNDGMFSNTFTAIYIVHFTGSRPALTKEIFCGTNSSDSEPAFSVPAGLLLLDLP
jgi:hypothetical protein